MSPRPEVVLYRDILGPSLLAFLRNDTNRSYTDSIAPTGETGKATRLSATTSIPLRSSQETARLLKLTKAITGLKIKKEREINIHSYAPGGQFPAHADSVRKHVIMLPRMRTVLTLSVLHNGEYLFPARSGRDANSHSTLLRKCSPPFSNNIALKSELYFVNWW